MINDFPNSVWVMLKDFCESNNPNSHTNNMFRRGIVEIDKIIMKTIPTKLSIGARVVEGIDEISKYSCSPKYVTWEHIISISKRIEAIKYLYSIKGWKTKNQIYQFLIDSHYIVWRLTDGSEDVTKGHEFEKAEIYLPEQYRNDKIKNFYETYPFKR